MVTADVIRPALRGASASVDVRWTSQGGHVGFPADVDLGVRAPRGLMPQVLAWFEQHGKAGQGQKAALARERASAKV